MVPRMGPLPGKSDVENETVFARFDHHEEESHSAPCVFALSHRIVAGLLLIAGLVTSIMAASVCEFVTYTADPDVVNSTNVPWPYTGSLDGEFGFTSYRLLLPDPNVTAEIEILQQDPEYNGTDTAPLIGECIFYNNSFYDSDNYEGEFHEEIFIGTLTTTLSILTALIAGLFYALECCCARFCCSRWLLSGFLLLSATGVSLTFLTLQSDLCSQDGRSCELGLGAYLAISCASCYFLAALFVAIGDKPITIAEYCCPKRFGKSKGSRVTASSAGKKTKKKKPKKPKKPKKKKEKKDTGPPPEPDPEPEPEPLFADDAQIADDYAAYQFDDDAGAYPISYT